MNKREMIMSLHFDCPDLRHSQLAVEVGCSQPYVYQVLKEYYADQDHDGEDTQIDAILDERGSRYGKFADQARVSQYLKREVASALGSKPISDDQREALDMICAKLGRILCGDPDYADSWIDIAGYAKLVADRLEGNSR